MEQKKVLFVASEVEPFAKTGGLADVAGSLPKELLKLGVDIRVVMPKYQAIPSKYVEKMEYLGYVYVPVGWRNKYCAVLKLVEDGVTYYFLDNEYYFKRDRLYGYDDEGEQFAFFSQAILKIFPIIQFTPDIIHCNDWQTAIIPVLLHSKQEFHPYRDIKTVLTIHNLKYQGIFPKEVMTELLNLSWDYFKHDRVEYHDCVNFLKGGLVYANKITTVSPTYANEIQTDYFGETLTDVLQRRHDDLVGILNGIDMEKNNPKTDTRLVANFTVRSLGGKMENKLELQKQLGLPVRANVPVIGIISRLVAQKGFDLIECILHELLKEDVQIVLLGTGDHQYESLFRHFAGIYPQKVSANIRYDGTLAQRIYAGSDMFLMPSLFEPCGLAQMFSMRYGTVPIVRETGGLNDTVQSYTEKTGKGNGFSFTHYNAHDMLHTIKRAIYFYREHPEVWKKIMGRGMRADWSWEQSARQYVELYEDL